MQCKSKAKRFDKYSLQLTLVRDKIQFNMHIKEPFRLKNKKE